MPLAGEMIKRLQDIDINQILDDSIREIEEFIIDLNQDQLYEKGQIDVNNPSRKEFYAESTKRQKLKRATYKRTDFVTLRWKGDFYKDFKVVIFDEEFIITSTDLKWANFLEPNKRFGDALGLTDESKSRLRKEILPVIVRRIREQL
jgi:hypothetical protein